MQVYIFRSAHDADVFGFTEDKTGGNLPAEFWPWARQGDAQALQTGNGPRAGVDGDAIIRAIRTEGYFLTRAAVTLTRPGPTPRLYH